MTLLDVEKTMWQDDPGEKPPLLDDRSINDRYIRGEGRIVIETNREKLDGFVEQLKKPNYLDLRPFYQRRPRWKPAQQSLLIESFIMNIPVPPIFLYEKDYNSFEVMDGQQRITAIRDFYDNTLKLKGLETWRELNGRTYKTLPEKIKAGIDRRSITSIVLLKESAESEEEASSLRETVFERLNTGGVELERQEIRNALYRSPFNDMLERITREDEFREVWNLPHYVENEIEINPILVKTPLFAKMGDAEIVLRFFALRHVDHYRRGMQGFLDLFMRRAMNFTDKEVAELETLYIRTLHVALRIYDDLIFCPYNADKKKWDDNPHKAFQDAVMVGLSRRLHLEDDLVAKSDLVIENTRQLFLSHPDGTFTGRGNTKSDVKERISKYEEMLDLVIYS